MEKIIERSLKIRKAYHNLEKEHHGSCWSVEEDALAYLTDAGLVGRNIMTEQNRWGNANDNSYAELKHKLGENMWWIIVLAKRSGIDIEEAILEFLDKTEKKILQ